MLKFYKWVAMPAMFLVLLFGWNCAAQAVSGEPEAQEGIAGTAYHVAQPTLRKAIIAQKTAITLIWNPVDDVDGYEVYRVDESGIKRIATIQGQAGKTYTDTELTYGETYRYVVKAYKEYNGEIYYSSGLDITKKLKARSRYVNGYKLYYDMDGQRLDNVDSFIGKKNQYLIKVNLKKSVVTIYAKDGKKGYTIPVKAYLSSGKKENRTGTWRMGAKTRYRTLFYNSYSQWAINIHGNILFHTVPYTKSRNAKSLDVAEYNKLGKAVSHGCIRMQCVGVKWLYDNCDSSTKVVFYNSNNPGPLGKPELEKIPDWHTWDPTDPTMQKKCRKAGCNHIKIY